MTPFVTIHRQGPPMPWQIIDRSYMQVLDEPSECWPAAQGELEGSQSADCGDFGTAVEDHDDLRVKASGNEGEATSRCEVEGEEGVGRARPTGEEEDVLLKLRGKTPESL